ncbi:hypothetical protein LK09_02040 [Microbacterium mangrovi]|uniref:3-hydroxyacyl-CoA dehydrogenase n=1 Tax=Microbacterium mangrovi TaxID=1348253 RepID=A0A0B2A931_9MICO|nr:hypothetical protein LK09_02040 [Microbacterium mangrovi]
MWDDDDRRRPVAALPDPEALIRNLARGILEVRAGVREPAQLARFLAQEPYRALVQRATQAAQARRRSGSAPVRPAISILSVRWTAPAADAIEAAVVVRPGDRIRAITMRLEAIGSRWRATDIVVI